MTDISPLAFSILLTLIFVLVLAARTLRQQQPISRWEGLLGMLALMLPIGALLANYVINPPETIPTVEQELTRIIQIGGGAAVVVGLLILLAERRRRQLPLGKSRALLGSGVGLLLILATITTPLLFGLALGETDLTAVFAQTAQAGDTVGSAATPEITDEPLLSPTPSPTFVPSATPTSYPTVITPSPMVTATPLALPTQIINTAAPTTAPITTGSTCPVTTGANLNLRRGPGTDQEMILTIPSGTLLTALATNTDRSWWQVTYNGATGWVTRDFLIFDAACNTVPSP